MLVYRFIINRKNNNHCNKFGISLGYLWKRDLSIKSKDILIPGSSSNQSFKRNYWKCTEDYEVHFTNGKNVFTVNDKFEIDVSQKKITFQKY